MKFLKKIQNKGFILFVVVIFGSFLFGNRFDRQPKEKQQQQTEVIEFLNKKHDLRHLTTVDQMIKGREYDCQFHFESALEDNKITLMVYFCASTSSAMKERGLADILTPQNLTMIKNAGFEQVNLYERYGNKLVAVKAIQSSD
jgi:hypothetical protein